MEKTCLECGASFIGRSDKKFCSDQCRTSYYNNQNRDTNNYMRNINNVLRKNRRILAELNPDGKQKVHKDKLVAKGYNFKFFTHAHKTKKGTVYYFCYEQGFMALEHDFYVLVERKEEL